ncbi:hypothetical protein [Anaeropeptidivorans aminofermentans]|uniref:hypothetical protein n=1 Tax=Anaeropeptidivorans aminofermentans TaxID=2934315 RepID=UPI000EE456BB|nr:hypothetical protein [Anaeropeptidivorans aminofermentans]HAQ39376.1 hypothetical protein [Clostridiales bacterium]
MKKGYEVIDINNNAIPFGSNYTWCPNEFMCNCGVNAAVCSCGDIDIECDCTIDWGCGSPPEIECAPNYGACGTRSIHR